MSIIYQFITIHILKKSKIYEKEIKKCRRLLRQSNFITNISRSNFKAARICFEVHQPIS